jgi:putative transposase
MRGLKLRIYPDEAQEKLINQTFGCVRKVYNNRLAERQNFYNNVIKPETDKEKRKNLYKTAHFSSEKELKQQFPYLKEVSAQALCFATMSAEKAYKNFFASLSGKRKGKSGFPKFKSKKSNDFSYKECNPSPKAWNRGDKTIQIPIVGKVKFRHHGKYNEFYTAEGAVLKSITIRKNPAGEYYAVLLIAREYNRKPKLYSNDESKTIGLDFSPSELYIDSNGKSAKDDFGYVAQKQRHWKSLRKLQRRLMRKQKGSKNREKARVKVARLENHIANSRGDYQEKESLRLVRNYEIIGIEDLNLKGISKFLYTAKNMTDTSWGDFTTKLIWKSSKNENNSQVVKVNRYFPSSQLCSKCGYQKKDLKLSDRKWVCPVCGTEHIRDVNAAVNIKNESLKIIGQGMSKSMPVKGHSPGSQGNLTSVGGSVETGNGNREVSSKVSLEYSRG